MSLIFYIPNYLHSHTGGRDRVILDASPRTVREALEALWQVHPGVRDRVVTEQGEIRPHVNIFVGEENTRFTGGMETRLSKGAEITIVPAVSGGGS